MTTFTQELIRKVIFSVFQQDRQLCTYFISLRVVQAESLTDEELLAFGLVGGKSYQTKDVLKIDNTSGLEWINHRNWSDIFYLTKLKPFSRASLLEHINLNPGQWSQYYRATHITFD